MKNLELITRLIAFIALTTFSGVSYSGPVDVYLVYLGQDKALQKTIKKALPSDLKVKGYNASLLTMADYSGKQKIIAKLSKARVTVLVTENPLALLGDANIDNLLVITGATEEDIEIITLSLQ